MPIDLAGPRVWRPGQGVFDGPAQQRRGEIIRQMAAGDNQGPARRRSARRLGSPRRVRRPRSRQAEDGIARSRFRARLNWYSQGQPLGR